MIRPSSVLGELPKKVSEWSQDDVRDWLYHGFANWHLQNTQPPPFFPLSDQFSRRESAEMGVASLCSRSARFRAMVIPEIKRLVEEVAPDQVGFRVFHHLQLLTAELHEPELLESIWMRLATPGFLDSAPADIRRELFARTFILAEKFAASTDAREFLISRMLSSNLFEAAWTPAVFSALVRSQPAQIGNTLAIMADHIDRPMPACEVAEIVNGCRAVILELGERHGDLLTLFEGINAEEIFSFSDDLDNRIITGKIATMLRSEIRLQTTGHDRADGGLYLDLREMVAGLRSVADDFLARTALKKVLGPIKLPNLWDTIQLRAQFRRRRDAMQSEIQAHPDDSFEKALGEHA